MNLNNFILPLLLNYEINQQKQLLHLIVFGKVCQDKFIIILSTSVFT